MFKGCAPYFLVENPKVIGSSTCDVGPISRYSSNRGMWSRHRHNQLRSHDVIWNNTFKGAPIHDIAFYFGPMQFMDIVQPHNPIRVLQQMGYVERILTEPYRPIGADRRSMANLYNVKYSYEAQFLEDLEGHLESIEQHSEKAKYPY
ncbi:hypothetical protein Scep_004784 [Stephania cephalantha]|uniref:Uncharacterized protein n=1 Tax=Stephania cephalantha TaxID=152367 RepID=A0AAP0KU00_9MAGN